MTTEIHLHGIKQTMIPTQNQLAMKRKECESETMLQNLDDWGEPAEKETWWMRASDRYNKTSQGHVEFSGERLKPRVVSLSHCPHQESTLLLGFL